MKTTITLDPNIKVINVGGTCNGYEVWDGDSYLHKVLFRANTQGQAFAWVIDNGYAKIERK